VTDLATWARRRVVVVCVFTDEQVQQSARRAFWLSRCGPAVLVIHTMRKSPHGRERRLPKQGYTASSGRRARQRRSHDIAAGQVTLFVGGADDGRKGPSGAGQLRRSHTSCGSDRSGQGVMLVNNTLSRADRTAARGRGASVIG